jgi:hypothetical protein
VEVSIAANIGPPRTGTLDVAGRNIAINQANGCRYNLSPAGYSAPATGALATVDIATASACPWNIASSVPWIAPAIASGVGPALAQLSIAANPGPGRAGTVNVAGSPFPVEQASLCTFMLNPTASAYDANGGQGLVLVFVVGTCTWSLASGAEWIRIESAESTGSGFARYTVGANGGGARSATVMIAGIPHTVTQAGK